MTKKQIKNFFNIPKDDTKILDNLLKELEDFLDVSHPTINGILKRLEEKGRITTELAVNHHLTKIVRITQSGLEDCKNSEYARLKSENILERNLSPEEKATLLQLMKKVQQSLIEEENK